MPQVNPSSWIMSSVKFSMAMIILMLSLNYMNEQYVSTKIKKSMNFYLMI